MKKEEDGKSRKSHSPSRRTFLKGMGVAASATVVLPRVLPAQSGNNEQELPGVDYIGKDAKRIHLTVNGERKELTVEPRTTLLEALRRELDLTGSKEICDRGSCGGCSVLVNGEAINSCLMLAMDAQNQEVVTIEGIAKDPKYNYLIESFCEHDAAQCGYCIPGFVVRSAELLEKNPTVDQEKIRQALSGNICRCGTYSMILYAVEDAARKKGATS